MARFLVHGNSMEPTLEWGERVLVSRLAIRVRGPARGDVVILRHPHRTRFLLVKRVVGVPGDTVRFEGGTLVINGIIVSRTLGVQLPSGHWHLGGDEYFVVGDRFDGSSDSRTFGPVPRSLLYGKVPFPRR